MKTWVYSVASISRASPYSLRRWVSSSTWLGIRDVRRPWRRSSLDPRGNGAKVIFSSAPFFPSSSFSFPLFSPDDSSRKLFRSTPISTVSSVFRPSVSYRPFRRFRLETGSDIISNATRVADTSLRTRSLNVS